MKKLNNNIKGLQYGEWIYVNNQLEFDNLVDHFGKYHTYGRFYGSDNYYFLRKKDAYTNKTWLYVYTKEERLDELDKDLKRLLQEIDEVKSK